MSKLLFNMFIAFLLLFYISLNRLLLLNQHVKSPLEMNIQNQ